MKKALVTLISLSAYVMGQVNETTPGWAVYDVPGLEAPSGTVVDVSYLNTEPAGSHGFIRVKDGRFVDDRNIPLRFYGTNLTGDACFPEVEDGKKLAKRLRQYGFNCLRLHFMDTNWHKDAIWKDPNKSEMNEANLRKLDAFIDACIKEGIYLNVNLHVARTYPGQPAFRPFHMGKILDRWYPEYIALQEDYARKLMGRVNTVTGMRYADTPGIMSVELNNENTMIKEFRNDLKKLPEKFQIELQRQWTAWLKAKYGTDKALRAVWEREFSPLGDVVVSDKNGWEPENSGGAISTVTPGAEGGFRWNATKAGSEAWNLQLQIRNFKLPPGGYTVSFEARSKTSSSVSHRIMLHGAPWSTLGLNMTCYLKPEWQKFEVYGQIAPAINDSFFRSNLDLKNRPGDIEIRNYTIRKGGGTPMPAKYTLATGIPIPAPTAQQVQMLDYTAFLIDTEIATTRRLMNFVKNTLGCKMPVTDSQANYGGLGGMKRETELSDYIDYHSYWEHPSYTRNEKGATVGFAIENTAAVANKNGGCIPALASWRVEGMPFSISEYNAPAPNDHSADMFPMYSVWASIQDWDAFFSYTYRDFGRDYANTHIRGYFQFIGRANMLVHVPFASLLYRRYLMPAAKTKTVIGIPSKDITRFVYKHIDANSLLKKHGGEQSAAASQRLSSRIVPTLTQSTLLEGDGKALRDKDGAVCSEDGSFKYLSTDPKGAWATLNLPMARMVTGHVAGRSFTLGDVTIDIDARDWPKKMLAFTCVTLIALDEKPIRESKKMLLALSGRTENSNMKWSENRKSLVFGKQRREHWGVKPTLSELIGATLSLPGDGQVKVTVLNAKGLPASSRQASAGHIRLSLEDKSLWYLIER